VDEELGQIARLGDFDKNWRAVGIGELLGLANAGIGKLLADGEDGEEEYPGEAHGVPVPGSGVDGDLAKFDALEEIDRGEADGESDQAEEEVGGVEAGNDVEEIAGGRGIAIEGEALRGELMPGGPLSGEEEAAEG